MGGVSAVTGVTKTSFPKRTITSQPKCGQEITVDVPTYITGIMQFESGAVGTIFTTFDVYYETQARLEIYGSKGTLIVPDPNGFDGPVKLLRPEQGEIMETFQKSNKEGRTIPLESRFERLEPMKNNSVHGIIDDIWS